MISVSTILSWLAWLARLISAGWRKIRRPRVKELRAPVNLFEHIQPYVSIEHLRDVFGVPYRTEQGWITFKFSDVFVQIVSKDGTTVSSADVLLRRISPFTIFPVYLLEYVLGKSTLASILDSDSEIKKEYSSKFFCVYVNRYFGFPGKYNHYTFGVYSGPGIRAPKYKWNNKINKLESDPNRVLVNWVRITSSKEEAVTPNFYHFL